MRPNPPAPWVRDICVGSNCGVFDRLKNSVRNVSAKRSVSGNRLKTEKSRLRVPGAKIAIEARLPGVPSAGATTALVSNHRSGVRPPGGGLFGFLPGTTSAVRPLQAQLLKEVPMLRGKPVWSVRIPLICQLPSSVSAAPLPSV